MLESQGWPDIKIFRSERRWLIEANVRWKTYLNGPTASMRRKIPPQALILAKYQVYLKVDDNSTITRSRVF